jgi:beta-phosphoglucomutase-like phosphatase (HAD superfamily)
VIVSAASLSRDVGRTGVANADELDIFDPRLDDDDEARGTRWWPAPEVEV